MAPNFGEEIPDQPVPNRHLIGTHEGDVVFGRPPGRLTVAQASELAAWLILLVEELNPDVDVAKTVRYVRRTREVTR